MQQYALGEQIAIFLESPLAKFKRSYERSNNLHFALLILAHVLGCAVMLSPLILLLSASATGLYLLNNIEGPLDWFMVEVLGAISLMSGFLSVQMYRSRPDLRAGVRIDQKQAPLLFSMLTRRVTHFGINPIDRVVLTPQAELLIKAVPSWPIPFFHKYTLCLGAPSLFFISPGQFRLALAGAIAASAQKQNSLRGRLVQASEDWSFIIDSLEEHTSLYAKLLLKPISRIAEFAEKHSAELLDDQQQTQGRWVLENTDEDNAREYLSNQVVASSFLDQHYWPMLFKAAERCPTPVVKPFSHFELILERTLTTEAAKRWLLHAQASRDNKYTDLHDLLAALSIDHLQWSKLPERNAFHGIFKSSTILKNLDKYWQCLVADEWNELHTSYCEEATRFKNLQERAQQQHLRGHSALHYIQLASKFLDKKEAISVYRRMYAGNQDNAGICFASGREMLMCGHSQEGCEALQRASELDSSFTKRARSLINEHKHDWLKQGNGVLNEAMSA